MKKILFALVAITLASCAAGTDEAAVKACDSTQVCVDTTCVDTCVVADTCAVDTAAVK